MGGFATPVSENPLLAQIRQQAKQQTQPPPSLLPPPGMDTGAPPIMQSSQPNVQAPRGTLTGEQNERNRLLGSKPGMSQVYNRITDSSFGQDHPLAGKLLGGAAQGLSTLGNIALSGAAPKLASLVPGTSAHHAALLGQEDKNINQLQGEQEKEAQTKNLEIQPQLRLAQQALQNEKQKEKTQNDAAKIDEQLRAHGYKRDEEGNIQPLSYEEMDPSHQAIIDLKGSQDELAQANAALKKAQKDGIPTQIALAEARIQNAHQNMLIAAGRLGLSRQEFEANYFGTNNGEPIVGAPADESGGAVGFKSPLAKGGGAAAQGRAAQGRAITEAAGKLQKEIDANKDLMGNMGSYWKQYTNGTPISDPRAAKLMAEFASFAALQPALHGFRSHDALREFAKMIGGIPNNPESAKSAIQGIVDEAATPMIHAGQGNTVKRSPQGGAESKPNDPLGIR